MAAEIQQEFGLDSQLIKGKGGVFLVKLDGESLYSKHETGRFPEPGEVEATLRNHLGAS